MIHNIKVEKVKDNSNLLIGPLSYIGVLIDDSFILRIEKEIVGDVSFWKKTKYRWNFTLKDIQKDKTTEISEKDFKELLTKIKKLDTDSSNYFSNKITKNNIV